jgi:hypothetical protein
MSVMCYMSVICLVLGEVVRVRLYIIYAHLCNHILLQSGWWDLGHSSIPVEVWVLGVGMSTPDAQTALYAEDRGLQVPMTLDHGPVPSSGQAAPGPDPRIRHRIQIGMFRPIRLDHTNCLQVAIKTHSFIRCIYECRCDERLQTKTKTFTHLAYTGLVVELEHLKIETTLIDEKFANVMGEYVT